MEPQRYTANRSQSVWTIGPRYSTIEFNIKNLFFMKVSGSFSDFSGTVLLDEDDLSRSSVGATIKAASISTGIKRRDAHLRSADFLDADKYPEIRFQSVRVERGRDRDTLRVAVTLTIKDRSREVVLNILETDRSRSPQGDEVAYYTALTEIDRFDFGVNYGRGLIGRTIKVTAQVQAIKQL